MKAWYESVSLIYHPIYIIQTEKPTSDIIPILDTQNLFIHTNHYMVWFSFAHPSMGKKCYVVVKPIILFRLHRMSKVQYTS